MDEFNEDNKKSNTDNPNSVFNLTLDSQNLQWGSREASYLTGFGGAIASLHLSENSLKEIILSKINLEYQKEMLRMKLESKERIANIYSKVPVIVSESSAGD